MQYLKRKSYKIFVPFVRYLTEQDSHLLLDLLGTVLTTVLLIKLLSISRIMAIVALGCLMLVPVVFAVLYAIDCALSETFSKSK